MGKLELVIETEKVSIYSPKYDGKANNEFEEFMLANSAYTDPQLQAFFNAIIAAINKVRDCGARENLFRPEGKNVKAVPLIISFRPNKHIGKMRLYCLRLSDRLLIIGNGGVSTKAKYDDDHILIAFVNNLRDIDKHLKKVAKQAGTDYEDFEATKMIIESITL